MKKIIFAISVFFIPFVAFASVTVAPDPLTNVSTSWTIGNVGGGGAYVYASDNAYMGEDDLSNFTGDYGTPQAMCTDRGTSCSPTGAWHIVQVSARSGSTATACGSSGGGYTACIASAGYIADTCFVVGTGSCGGGGGGGSTSTAFDTLFGSATSTASTTKSLTIVSDPNRDMANMFYIFLIGFFGTYWVFSKKR